MGLHGILFIVFASLCAICVGLATGSWLWMFAVSFFFGAITNFAILAYKKARALFLL